MAKPVRLKTLPYFLASEGIRGVGPVLHILAGLKLGDNIAARWNPRLVSTAGRVLYRHRFPVLVELNPALKADPDELRVTALHESAHVIAAAVFGDTGHGPYWRRVCGDIGLPNPTRCHNHRSIAQARAKLVAVCVDCGSKVFRSRYYPRRKVYYCTQCGADMVTHDRALLARIEAERATIITVDGRLLRY